MDGAEEETLWLSSTGMYIGMTATDVMCMYTYYMSVHVQYTIHSGVGIIVLATSDWVMHALVW